MDPVTKVAILSLLAGSFVVSIAILAKRTKMKLDLELERLILAYRYSTDKHLYCTIRYDGTDNRCQICQHADIALEGKDAI